MKPLSVVAILVTGLFVTACGGGGGGSASSVPVSQPASPTVSITTSGLHVAIVFRSYSEKLSVTSSSGFLVTASGSLPPGLTMDATGTITGTPTQTGVFPINFTATNGTTPSVTASKTLTMQVVTTGTVRNDSLASATALACCGTISASLSPYSTAAGVAAPDQDYYQITANAGDKISIDAVAIGTAIDTDTVIEVLDVNGNRMNVCNTPQSTTNNFSSACLNDDINPGIIRNSHLDTQLPATSGVFVVHVLDWLGRARPEMTYELRTVKLQ